MTIFYGIVATLFFGLGCLVIAIIIHQFVTEGISTVNEVQVLLVFIVSALFFAMMELSK